MQQLLVRPRSGGGVVVRVHGQDVVVKSLLKVGSNPKLLKSEEYGFRTAGLSLAPADSSGYQTCPMASPGCKTGCLFKSGMGGLFPNVPKARIARTLAFFEHRPWFLNRLNKELGRFVKRCDRDGMRPVCRLNVFSDIPWEMLAPRLFEHDLQLMDYTAVPARYERYLRGELPSNYHLTFSRKEDNDNDCVRFLKAGGTVAVVFADKLPRTYLGFPVVDGDVHDLRFLDCPRRVIGLKAKGPARRDTTGFVVRA